MILRLTILGLLSFLPLAAADDTRLVRETEAQTPDQELAKLHIPDGFAVQLFAAEPMIHKPVNMAFDARGRLWVSSTVEYPYSANKRRWSDAQGTHVEGSRDAIKILEDTDGDGQADKVTDFADQLNIPTGVLPWHKPEHKAGCIAWSIPNIWYFADADGDDKADVREVLFGPLGFEKDTHGMCSSFRLGLDGWVYATHGFNNTSHFKAKDGSTLDLHSGNVFRFRPDGSRVEPWTWGQVNPFGLCWDRYNNLYSADCHSAPIYQLIRGAHYPSFGKAHDGLGFGPVMCQHSHGSTGICGIVYIDGGVWGAEWDDHTFVGNVVTSRVNHDRVSFTGSSPKANEQPDFITCDDPWFRPIDLQLGPDNALYVADFYNRIIGHYEVPLEHPGRDKERGRIWRVVKKGSAGALTNFAIMDAKALAAEMESPNLTRRRLALGEVNRRGKPEWAQTFLDFIGSEDEQPPLLPRGDAAPRDWKEGDGPHDASGEFWPKRMTMGTAYALWACSYLGERAVVSGTLRGLLGGGAFVVDRKVGDTDQAETPFGLVMAHATRVLGTYEQLHPWEMQWLSFIFDCRGWPAGRAGAEVLINRPDYLLPGVDDKWGFRGFAVNEPLQLYLGMVAPRHRGKPELWENSRDTHFMHALRVLLRDFWSQAGVLKHPMVMEALQEVLQKPEWREAVMDLLAAVPNAEAASLLLRHANDPGETPPAVWSHIARHANVRTLGEVIGKARKLESGSDAEVKTIEALCNGISERGLPPNAEVVAWAQDLAVTLLKDVGHFPAPAWARMSQTVPPPLWSLVVRKCSDGTDAVVLQSMKRGGADEEKRTGVLASKPFVVPAKLRFWINGHRGFPAAAAHDKNLVRLVDAASGKVLATAFPPRNDRCEPVEWKLSDHKGKTVRLELVDGDDGSAYAWLGITRIDPPVVRVEEFETSDAARNGLSVLASLISHTAPAALRERLAPFLPPRPPPPPLPVSPEERRRLDVLIAQRAVAAAKMKPDLARGRRVFAAQCAACHSIGGQGGMVGPQLDGIGHRGIERLAEDILDPNRNVDAHFQIHTMRLRNGEVASGFLKAELGKTLILSDATGREHRIAKDDVSADEIAPVSLMPPTFGQALSELDLGDLVGWLMMQR